MKSTKTKRITAEQWLQKVFSERFAAKDITVYRYNSASIRVRIIDRTFHGKSIVEREAMVDPLIDKLPEDVQAQLTILLLLSPSEKKSSLMNMEFSEPAPSLS